MHGVGKLALIKHQRPNNSSAPTAVYASSRPIRDIERRIVGNEDLREAFVRPLFLARRVLEES